MLKVFAGARRSASDFEALVESEFEARVQHLINTKLRPADRGQLEVLLPNMKNTYDQCHEMFKLVLDRGEDDSGKKFAELQEYAGNSSFHFEKKIFFAPCAAQRKCRPCLQGYRRFLEAPSKFDKCVSDSFGVSKRDSPCFSRLVGPGRFYFVAACLESLNFT